MVRNRARIGKLEHSLSPKEAAMLWIEEAHTFPTLMAYAASLVGKPHSAFPLVRLSAQVESWVRQQKKGEHPDQVGAEVRRAVRDVTFLAHLHFEANTRVMDSHRGDLMHLLFLLEWMRRFIHVDPAKSEEQLREEAALWRQFALALLANVYTLAGAISRLGDTYFEGRDLLFPAIREELDLSPGTLRWKAARFVSSRRSFAPLFSLRSKR